MIIGMGISQLIEPPGKAMKFDLEEVETEEARWYLGLTNVEDKVGSLETLRDHKQSETKRPPRKPKGLSAPRAEPSRRQQAAGGQTSKIVAIEEMSDDEEEEDDIVPYEKPDSDPSDSEEDPTLIQRSKPTRPV